MKMIYVDNTGERTMIYNHENGTATFGGDWEIYSGIEEHGHWVFIGKL